MMHISADGSATLQKVHDLAQRVHDGIEAQCPRVKHCMVHVNPAEQDIKGGEMNGLRQ